jgi:Zn-dependent protease
VLLLPAAYLALKLWAGYVARRILGLLPFCPDLFEAVADELVPADSRETLEAYAAPLEALGFARVGYLRVTDDLVPETRPRLVLRHAHEPAFAIVGVGLLGGELGIACDLITLLEDGTWLCTQNGRKYQHFALPTSGRYSDAFVTTFYAQWQTHRATIGTAGPARASASVSELAAVLTAGGEEALRGAIERGEIARAGAGAPPLRTALGVRGAIERLRSGQARAAAAKLTSGDFKARRLPIEDQERFFTEMMLLRELRRRAASPWLILAITAAGFALSTFLTMDVTWIVLLMPALLFHELGHWTVMRLCGHRDARIAFVPFLGAVTMTQRPFAKRWQEIAMLLAGPLPGLVLGIVLTMAAMTHGWTRLTHVGAMLIGLNALNLLPLQPLDGGRIFHVLIAAGRPLLDLALRAVATLVFVYAAVKLGDPVLGLLALAGVFVLRAGYRNQAVEKKIRAAPDYDASWPEAERRRRIFGALAEGPERRLHPWFEAALALDLQLRTRRPPLWQSLFWFGAFATVVGGSVLLYLYGPSFRDEYACPRLEQAQSLACGDAKALTALPWDKPAHGRNPEANAPEVKGAGRRLPAAAFVWCESDDEARLTLLLARFQEAAAGAAFCEALPWELPPSIVPNGTRERARTTLARLTGPYASLNVPGVRLAFLERVLPHAKDKAWFDAETAQLLRRSLGAADAEKRELERALGERLGRSSTESCRALVVKRAETAYGARADAGATAGDAGSSAADGGAAALDDEVNEPVIGLRLSVELKEPGALAPLVDYLCGAGCRVHALPFQAGSLELQYCF